MKRPSFSLLFESLRQHGRHISTAFFIGGFTLDYFFLPKTDNILTPYIGIFYAIGFALALFGRTMILTKVRDDVFGNKITSLFSLLLAYFSGSILSYIFILYFRSALVAASLPFFLLALFAMCANEFVRTKEYRTYLDTSIFFFSLTSVLVFVIPYLTSSVSTTSFMLSLVCSLFLSVLFVYATLRNSAREVVQPLGMYVLTLWSPFLFLFLYMTQSVPPLPVSLSSAKIYHFVVKDGDIYTVFEEKKEKLSSLYHIEEGKPIYFFSTIYAPVKLRAPVSHAWEYYDEDKKAWVEKMRVDFTIVGGRREGYRGYSVLKNTMPGKWRINVLLDDKRLVGRHYFSLESVAPEALVRSIR